MKNEDRRLVGIYYGLQKIRKEKTKMKAAAKRKTKFLR